MSLSDLDVSLLPPLSPERGGIEEPEATASGKRARPNEPSALKGRHRHRRICRPRGACVVFSCDLDPRLTLSGSMIPPHSGLRGYLIRTILAPKGRQSIAMGVSPGSTKRPTSKLRRGDINSASESTYVAASGLDRCGTRRGRSLGSRPGLHSAAPSGLKISFSDSL